MCVEKYKGYMCSKEGRLSFCGFKNMYFSYIYIYDCFSLEICFMFELYHIVTFFSIIFSLQMVNER